MLNELVSGMVRNMTTEDRVFTAVDIIGQVIKRNDIDVLIPMLEAKYRLMTDDFQKAGQQALIKFLREVNTIRPHALEFMRLVEKQLGEKKTLGGCHHDHDND